MNYTRNEFLKLAGISLSGAAMINVSDKFIGQSREKEEKFTLGLASYTFRAFSLEDTIKAAQRLQLKSISLKDKHMSLTSSADDIKKIVESVRNAGLNLYGVGVIYMKTPQEVESAFVYASNAGVEMIIGVPNHELLPLAEEQVKKYNIKLAIHNHGPNDKLYPSVDDVHDKIKDLDKRIGYCIDIGHVKNLGQEPVTMLERYKDRLYDIHMKDIFKAFEKEPSVEIGRGIIDIPKVIKTLKKIKYSGNVAFEYEKDEKDPLAGLAESVGYVRGVMSMI